MTSTEQHRDSITEQGGLLIGSYRRPRNLAANQRGSIHDDATAQRLGFRGGTVAGSIHMEQFPPMLLRAFGARWFERGGLSCYFRNATIDNEAVRALVQMPSSADDCQVNVWMERDDGLQVLEGTASIGAPPASSMLARKMGEPRQAGELRILSHLSAGQELEPVRSRLTARDAGPRLAAITEPLDWYSGDSPWGGPIANPGLVVHLMVAIQRSMRLGLKAVGLYGAIEVRHINGPVFADVDYEVSGRIAALGTTPKTEYMWYETLLREPGGKDVASMLMMLRFMKASSASWNGS